MGIALYIGNICLWNMKYKWSQQKQQKVKYNNYGQKWYKQGEKLMT